MVSSGTEILDNLSPAASNASSETINFENQAPEQVSELSINNETLEGQNPEVSHVPRSEGEGEEEEEEGEEDEGECGFCLFMKGGECKESFIAWEKCVEDAEKSKEDVVEKCFEVTGLLKKCMDAHADYYEPILQAEKAMEEEAAKELERESDRETAPKEDKQES
ncbi:PREDICTED: uncharacterized protein LOC104598050 [Nelumbo nucifera]|uniref:Uncharacterized protein LOC104598050 n=2 Tax=Nelumbo nucifera TaxID=4432 RepID=A0A1U8A0N7_NELNU|nr:PREDICTED: uncharacterized protein LOC104598050 [Nelumbo nucifera]DAD34928.1 TPA_asm: hypothetical protein HUJ06_005568 [Nelumbo nucifera]